MPWQSVERFKKNCFVVLLEDHISLLLAIFTLEKFWNFNETRQTRITQAVGYHFSIVNGRL